MLCSSCFQIGLKTKQNSRPHESSTRPSRALWDRLESLLFVQKYKRPVKRSELSYAVNSDRHPFVHSQNKTPATYSKGLPMKMYLKLSILKRKHSPSQGGAIKRSFPSTPAAHLSNKTVYRPPKVFCSASLSICMNCFIQLATL